MKSKLTLLLTLTLLVISCEDIENSELKRLGILSIQIKNLIFENVMDIVAKV